MRVVRLVVLLLYSLPAVLSFQSLHAGSSAATQVYLPAVILAPDDSMPLGRPEERINHYRHLAGVPSVAFDEQLGEHCDEHARYMAEENHLTHRQRTDSPWHTTTGQRCAENANVFLAQGVWPPASAIDWWMGSTGHRLWLLYPTTPIFGHGHYIAENGYSAGTLDILTHFDGDRDREYSGWPVRYPAEAQQGVPNERYPITVAWPYFGPSPTLESSTLRTAAGNNLEHTATTDLPAGHQGIELLTERPLPTGSEIVVTVQGTYDGVPFTYRWTFFTRE